MTIRSERKGPKRDTANESKAIFIKRGDKWGVAERLHERLPLAKRFTLRTCVNIFHFYEKVSNKFCVLMGKRWHDDGRSPEEAVQITKQ